MRYDRSRLLTPQTPSGRTSVVRGSVAYVPADETQPIDVTVMRFSGEYSYEVPASNRPPGVPPVGTQCVVLLDDFGDAWITAWSIDSGVLPSSAFAFFSG